MKKVRKSNPRTRQTPRREVFPVADRSEDFAMLSENLAEAGRAFYARGWALGTSGNFSAVISREPLRLAITSTGLDKGTLTPEHFLEIGESNEVLRGRERPSAEALLHRTVVRELNAGAVLHTHSVWSTVLSGSHAANGGIHGFLLREHGLYTWGSDLQEARRHVEILEFLMEVLVRAGAAATR